MVSRFLRVDLRSLIEWLPLLLMVIASNWCWGGSLATADDRPNILLLFADDQRADTIAAWGNPAITTPNLDGLARRGFSFRRNYCFGSNSGAVCVPSRAMLLSGKTWFDLPKQLEGQELFPERLRKAGYRTFATGKWHNGKPSLQRTFPTGRSLFIGGMADHTKVPVVDIEQGEFTNSRIAIRFSSEEFAEAAIEFLNQDHEGRPFFCYVAFTAPHDPRNPPPEYRESYYRHPPPLPANFLPEHPFDNGFAKNLRDENLAAYPRTASVIRDQLCEYYGSITHLDEQVGRILRTLEQRGLRDNTLVIYAADHGLALGSHGLLGKQSVYEHSMRAPLIVAGPGVPSAGETTAFTYLFDLTPTLLTAARVPLPDGLAGLDLAPIWRGERSSIRDSVFLPFTDQMRAVREDRWKLIVYPPINQRQLFDLQNDSDEIQDVSTHPENQAEIQRLLGLLDDWRGRVGDTLPLSSPTPRSKSIRYDDFTRNPDEWQPDWIVRKYFDRKPP